MGDALRFESYDQQTSMKGRDEAEKPTGRISIWAFIEETWEAFILWNLEFSAGSWILSFGYWFII